MHLRLNSAVSLRLQEIFDPEATPKVSGRSPVGNGDVHEEKVKSSCTKSVSPSALCVGLGYWSGGSVSNSLVALSRTGELSSFLRHPPMSKMEPDVLYAAHCSE